MGSRLDGSDNLSLRETYLAQRQALVRYFAARTGSAATAEDIVQDIYIRLADIAPGAAIANPLAYLMRIGANVMLNRLRGERRQGARDLAWQELRAGQVMGAPVHDEPPADAVAAARQQLAQVMAAIEAFPPQMRTVFRLCRIEGLGQGEVATRLGISKSAVEKHVAGAMRRLAQSPGRGE